MTRSSVTDIARILDPLFGNDIFRYKDKLHAHVTLADVVVNATESGAPKQNF